MLVLPILLFMGKKEKENMLKFYAKYSTLGLQMVIIILAGAFGGRELDNWLEFDFPVFTVSLTILAVVISVVYGTRELFKNNNNKSDEINKK